MSFWPTKISVFAFLTLTYVSHAYSQTFDNLKLTAPLPGSTYITAELYSSSAVRCAQINNIKAAFTHDAALNNEIDIIIDLEQNPPLCSEYSLFLPERFFLGELQDGTYTFNIYENDQLSFSETLSVPLDVSVDTLGFTRFHDYGSHKQNSEEIPF